MRLTLRTLLAYLDDTLEPAEIKQIGQKVNESQSAQELIDRIKRVTRRRRLAAPPAASQSDKFDANTIAEYLDNTLPADQVAEVEKLCLESDVHLAEIATCHQILTLVLGEPALVPPAAKRRMYALVQGSRARTSPQAGRLTPGPMAEVEGLETGDQPPPKTGSAAWMGWLIPVAGCLLLAGVAFAIWQALYSEPERSGRPRAAADRKQNVEPPKDQGQQDGQAKQGGGGQKTENGGARKGGGDEEKGSTGGPDKGGQGDAKEPDKKEPDKKEPDKKEPDGKQPDKEPDGAAPPGQVVYAGWPPVGPASTERRALGRLAREAAGSDALMHAPADGSKWERLTPSGRAYSTDWLVSLPGFRSRLNLDSGVGLYLWGNVPEHLPLPVFESAVVLYAPAGKAGAPDADFRLDRGRVWVTNQKKDRQPAIVRVRFGRDRFGKEQVWDLKMDPGGEVGLEIVGRELGFAPGRSEEGPHQFLTLLVTKGKLRLRDDFHEYDMSQPPGLALYFWENKAQGSLDQPRKLDQLPDAWSQTPPAPRQESKLMDDALTSLRERMAGAKDPVILLAETVELPNPAGASRFLGVLCQGALDRLNEVVEDLGDERNYDVREAAVQALRHWLGRADGQDKRLREGLKGKYKQAEIDAVLSLLRIPDASDLDKRETYEFFVENLGHSQTAIRHLAFWHLQRLAAKLLQGDRTLTFDPAGDSTAREAAVKKWKKLLDDGKLPPEMPQPGGGRPQGKPR